MKSTIRGDTSRLTEQGRTGSYGRLFFTHRGRASMRITGATVLGGLVLAATMVMAAGSGGNEQLIKYYRKKANVPPAQKVAVTGVKDSSIKGAKEGTLEIGEGAAAQKVPFTMSPDCTKTSSPPRFSISS